MATMGSSHDRNVAPYHSGWTLFKLFNESSQFGQHLGSSLSFQRAQHKQTIKLLLGKVQGLQHWFLCQVRMQSFLLQCAQLPVDQSINLGFLR